MLPSTHNKNKKRKHFGRKKKVVEEMSNGRILLEYDLPVCHDRSRNKGKPYPSSNPYSPYPWSLLKKRNITTFSQVSFGFGTAVKAVLAKGPSLNEIFRDFGKTRRSFKSFFKFFSWKWSRIRSSSTRKELLSDQFDSRTTPSNNLLEQPCPDVDTTFRNCFELKTYGHLKANLATRESKGEWDETVEIARTIWPAVIFVYEQQNLLV